MYDGDRSTTLQAVRWAALKAAVDIDMTGISAFQV
jgi:hypothetical protein